MFRSQHAGTLIFALTSTLATAAAARAEPATLGAIDDCVVRHDATQGLWTLENDRIRLSLGFDRTSTLRLQSFSRADDRANVLAATAADAALVVNGRNVELSNRRASGVSLAGQRVEAAEGGLQLGLDFDVFGVATLERIYACYPHSSIVESWMTIRPTSGDASVEVGSPLLLSVAVPAGEVEWVRGLEAPEDTNGSFTRERQLLAPDERLELGAAGRSTQWTMPFVAVSTPAGRWFAGLRWSGAWAMDATGGAGTVAVRAALPDLETSLTAGALDTPRVFMGLVGPDAGHISAAMRDYALDTVRGGRPLGPLVTYNTWFVYGARIDADAVAREIRDGARLGIELFELDAGWYEGAGAAGPYDFTSGLGSWRVDHDRFPDGLRPLGDLARRQGMHFGVWVEPERVARAWVGREGMADEAWLATSGGAYEPGTANDEARAAQLCLVDPNAWQWVYGRLVAFVEENDVDYLKWDNNFWVNCDRDGHGHGPRDGNLRHVQALYRLLEALRERFPNLLIENVSGGGNRLDMGMLAYTDAAWMDDRTAPSVHVRHNLEGLAELLPPAYLLSYVMPSEAEPLVDAADPSWIVRSRMPGILGFSYRTGEIDRDDERRFAADVNQWKGVRDVLAAASAVTLTTQVSIASLPPWDAVANVSRARDVAVVFAFANDPASPGTRLRLSNLDPDAVYEIISSDRGSLGEAQGRVLMEDGLDITATSETRAQVVLLRATASAAQPSRRSP